MQIDYLVTYLEIRISDTLVQMYIMQIDHTLVFFFLVTTEPNGTYTFKPGIWQ